MKLSTTYKVQRGDTLSSITKKVYGFDLGNDFVVSQANPGMQSLREGDNLIVPTLPDAPKDFSQSHSDSSNEVSIHIDGKRFRFWTEVELKSSMDSFSTVDFVAPFDPKNKEFREIFRPLSFKSALVYIGSDLAFSGTLMNPYSDVSDSSIVSVNCYSRCGVINDCTAPASAFPFEVNGQGIQAVAKALLSPFGIGAYSGGDDTSRTQKAFFEETVQPFERTALGTDEIVLSYLSDLAKQRNLLVSDDANGNISFIKPIDVGSPIAILHEGMSPLISVKPSIDAQKAFSHVTAIEPTSIGASGGQYTVRNDAITALRPLTFISKDAEGGNLRLSAESKMGRMIGGMASYTIRVHTWRTPSGALWQKNKTLILKAPSAMIYEEYEFIIKDVVLARSDQSFAELTLVLPESFSGKMPKVMPWDE